MTVGAYPHLFSPFHIGRLALGNRLVVPGLTTNYATEAGEVTDALCAYLAARARGGFGLVVTENLGVHPGGRVMPRMVMAHEDRLIRGLKRLARAVKQEGARVVAQLSHAGRQTKRKITGLPLVAPSAIPCPVNREMPEALSADGVRAMADAFVRAAVRCAEAGFEGIEVHGAHGYLVGAFLSRYANRREDAYGGSLDGRLRFLLDIVAGIQAALGRDFPLLVRISAREFVEDGLDVPEAVEIARRLAAHGVHALSVSVGVYESFNRVSMVSGEPEGQWLPVAAAVRAGSPLPIIGVGRLKRPQVAEAAIAGGQIDLAALGRASIADPDLPRKAREGREADIVWCLGCNVCLGRSARPETICPVNPAVGREAGFIVPVTGRPLRLAVLGTAVPALTAAWVAARRGHRVTLHEPGPVTGGLQGLRARVPGQEEIAETVQALVRRALDAGATLAPTPPARAEHDVVWGVRALKPVMRPEAPAVAGLVDCYAVLAAARDVRLAPQARVMGDDLAAAEAALVLAAQGSAVALGSTAADIAVDAHPGFREVTRRALARLGATVATRVAADWAWTGGGEALVVVGRDPHLPETDESAWHRPPLPVAVDDYLDDAWEPGRLTTAVYAAVARARALAAP